MGKRLGSDTKNPRRQAAAQDSKRRPERILESDKPSGRSVRLKRPSEQPVGWNPDLKDGRRLNTRPYVTAEDLRNNRKPEFDFTCEDGCGKDVEITHCFVVFRGDGINDHYLALAEKRAVRGREP